MNSFPLIVSLSDHGGLMQWMRPRDMSTASPQPLTPSQHPYAGVYPPTLRPGPITEVPSGSKDGVGQASPA